MQQLPPLTSPRSLVDYAVYLLAIIFAGGWFQQWWNRKVPKSTIGLQDAQREKTLAEAHRIVVNDAIQSLGEAKVTIQQMKEENGQLKRDLMMLGAENDRLREKGRAK